MASSSSSPCAGQRIGNHGGILKNLNYWTTLNKKIDEGTLKKKRKARKLEMFNWTESSAAQPNSAEGDLVS